MELKEALHWVLNGQGVAFLGAGFGYNALNQNNEKFPSATQLANSLQEKVGITDEELTLLDASEEFIEEFGREKLYRYIQSSFKVKKTEIDYSPFSSVPWKRVYTTNYDDLVERTFNKTGAQVNSLILDDEPSLMLGDAVNCVHLNGFVEKMALNKFDSEFKLTNSSYLTDMFVKSSWKTIFNCDLRESKVIIFIGYSLYDIDIQKILVEDESLKGKCFFITEPNPKERIERKLSKYGKVVKTGVDGFMLNLQEAINSWDESERSFEYTSITELPSLIPRGNVKSNDVIDLLLYGKKDLSLINYNLSGGEDKYYIFRRSIRDIPYNLKTKGCVVVHSKLANGKSLFLDGASQFLRDKGYNVFRLVDGRNITSEEIEKLKEELRPVLLIENYHRNLKNIELIQSMNGDCIKLLLTCRTELHELYCENLDDNLVQYDEYNLNNLERSDISNLINLLSENGLFGDKASLTDRQKEKFVKNDLRGEFSLVLSHILKAPQIEERVKEILEKILKNESQKKAVLLCSLFSYLGYSLHLLDLQTLLEERNVGDVKFFKDQNISQLIHQNENNNIALKNTVLAKYLIDYLVKHNPDELLDFMITLYIKLSNNSEYEVYYQNIARDLNVFSILSKIFGINNIDKILDFYDRTRVYLDNENNHHFWLQYAIARLSNKEYDVADRLIQNAYSIADKHRKYNRDWIDSQYARLLIETAELRSTSKEMIGQIKHAHNLVIRQDNHHYPFRIATCYFKFVEDNHKLLSKDDIKSIIDMSLDFKRKYSPTIQSMRNDHHPVMKAFKRECDKFLNKWHV